MMKFSIGILSCILFFSVNAYAQNGNYNSGARSSSISNTSITISDAFAAYNNVAALASLNEISAYFFSTIHYGIPGLFTVGTGFNSRLFTGIATINFYRFGDNLYSEQKIGLGYSHKIRFVSLGLQINYIQYRIEGYGSRGYLSTEFGGVIKICQELLFGAYLFKSWESGLYPDNNYILPMLLKTGISYRPVINLMINIEYQYHEYIRQYLSFGMEYLIREKLALRTGITIQTLKSTFGIGFKPGRFDINYGVAVHPHLDVSHDFSINLKISQ
jgi:hypothetical protein